MSNILAKPTFKWLPKHLNHIAENIKLKNRNVSFLAINALFRSKNYTLTKGLTPFEDSYTVRGFVDLQKNDLLRLKSDYLSVVFYLDIHNNIIPITAYSDGDH